MAELLRGPKGTQVKVSVKREGATGTVVTATITRAGSRPAWWTRFGAAGIVYLGVTSFEAQNISRDVETGLQKLGEQNAQGLVLDLRNNLGGLVTEAVEPGGPVPAERADRGLAPRPRRAGADLPRQGQYARAEVSRSSCW